MVLHHQKDPTAQMVQYHPMPRMDRFDPAVQLDPEDQVDLTVPKNPMNPEDLMARESQFVHLTQCHQTIPVILAVLVVLDIQILPGFQSFRLAPMNREGQMDLENREAQLNQVSQKHQLLPDFHQVPEVLRVLKVQRVQLALLVLVGRRNLRYPVVREVQMDLSRPMVQKALKHLDHL